MAQITEMLHRGAWPRSHRFGDFFLASSFGLVGISTAAIQPRQVVHTCNNLQKSSHQTEATEAKRHGVFQEVHARNET